MKVTVAKVGMELVDKLTGIAYVIEATDEAANGTITKATATEILDENDEREPKKVTVDATNDLTFRVTKWIADVEKHAASISNGILTIDGKDVVMGSIVAKKILKIFPGTVVFTASKEDEERDLVYEYTPSRDKFSVLGSMEPDVRVIEDTDTRVVYGFSFTKEIETEKDGEKTRETVFDRAGLYVLTKGRFEYTALALDNGGYDEDEDEDEYDEYEESEPELKNFLGFDLTRVVIAQGDKYFYIPAVAEEKDVTYSVYRITNAARNEGEVTMPGFLTAVTTNNTGARVGKVIFSGEGFVKIDNFIIRSNELRGYIYLVDATRDQANDVNTYTLSNEARQLKKAVRKNTPDRGEIITIE